MDPLRAVAMGIIQGATEFLPVSSSGHLVLIPHLLRWPIPSVAFDALVHWGTLLAVLAYFRSELIALAKAWLRSITAGERSYQAYLSWLILLATVPGVVAGVTLDDFFEALFSSPRLVSVALIGTALLLVLAELRLKPRKGMEQLNWLNALFIGLFQALAITPGISRSGSTITAGILAGLSREEAARFSFLLSVPIIFGAGLKKLLDLAFAGELGSQWFILLVGFTSALVSGYLSIAFLLSFVKRRRLYVFAFYCLALGFLGLVLS